jgi:hypothetical protein
MPALFYNVILEKEIKCLFIDQKQGTVIFKVVTLKLTCTFAFTTLQASYKR